MGKKKQVLKSSIDADVSLIGITCQLKSYRLSFSINKALRFGFRRIDDLEIPAYNGSDVMGYPFLVYKHPELKNDFCLIGNHHPRGKLLPSIRQADYLLMARNPLDNNTKAGMMEKIRKISQVVAAYEIDPLRIKDMDELLEEMELHLLTSARKKNAARA